MYLDFKMELFDLLSNKCSIIKTSQQSAYIYLPEECFEDIICRIVTWVK